MNIKDLFNEEDLVKLWKGLHYCMWSCDKPLIQVRILPIIRNIMYWDCVRTYITFEWS